MFVFKDYDIRGVYPKEIDERFAFKLGRAYAAVFKPKKVFVGQDCRVSSGVLANEFIHGLVVQGIAVVDIGLCSTPMLYFAGKFGDAVIITASHNPPKYNGFKICRKGKAVGYATGLKLLESALNKRYLAKSPGSLARKNLMHRYVRHVLSFAKKTKKSKIVIDAGNGMAGVIAPEIFKHLNVNVKELFFELDGRFPNRSPNPILPGALDKLGKEVRKQKADAGFAYDGDCDRFVVVDEKGNVVGPDAFASLLIKRLPRKSKVVITPVASTALMRAIYENKCTAVMSKAGHTNVSLMMKRCNALFGVEESGHYFFKHNFYLDSGDIAAVKALSLFGKKRLSELAAGYESKFAIGKVVSVFEGNRIINRLKKVKGAVHTSIDGERVDFDYGWICARKSNTEPIFRIAGEALDSAGLRKLKRLL